MSDSVSFRYTVTEEDFVWAMRFHYRTLRWMWIFLCAVAGFGIVIIAARVMVVLLKDELSLELVPLLIGAAVLGVAAWWYWTWYPRRLARKSPHVGVEFDTEFSSHGITSNSSLGSGQLKWAIYTSAHETADYFALCSGESMLRPYPKRNISSPQDVDRLRELIRTNVPKTKLLSTPA